MYLSRYGFGLAAVGVIDDRCRRSGLAELEQVPSPQVQFSTRHALWVLCCWPSSSSRLNRFSRAQGGATGGVGKNEIASACARAVGDINFSLNGHVQS